MNAYAEQIVNSVTMREVCDMYGIEVNRTGFICCPFHSERTASLKIFPDNRGFYCFGCGAGSSVIDFVMKYFDLTFQGAMVKINNDFSLGLPIGRKPTLREKRQSEKVLKEKQTQKSERERLQAEYDKALADYIAIDKQFNEYKPKNPDEPPHPLFIEALQKKEVLSANLDEAEDNLRNYDNR